MSESLVLPLTYFRCRGLDSSGEYGGELGPICRAYVSYHLSCPKEGRRPVPFKFAGQWWVSVGYTLRNGRTISDVELYKLLPIVDFKACFGDPSPFKANDESYEWDDDDPRQPWNLPMGAYHGERLQLKSGPLVGEFVLTGPETAAAIDTKQTKVLVQQELF